MSSSTPGSTTSGVEITNIDAHGIWMLCHHEELFLSYRNFPWFKNQPPSKIRNVHEVTPEHFHWPDMDVDLSLASIRRPDAFPLKAKR